MAELNVLEELGLSPAEAKIYLSLIEIGSTLAGPIIKRTGLHRGTTYQILQRLKEKGLVSSIVKGKKQYFEPANPDRLMDSLKEREEKLHEILPSLKAKLIASKEKQEITVYSGIKGIRTALDTMMEELTPHGEYYDFGAAGSFRELMGSYWDSWQNKKEKHKIKSKVIFSEEALKKNPKLLEDYYGEVRFLPSEYPTFTDTMIYQDAIIFLIWTAKPPLAVIIKNKDNALSYKNQFKLVWKIARKR